MLINNMQYTFILTCFIIYYKFYFVGFKVNYFFFNKYKHFIDIINNILYNHTYIYKNRIDAIIIFVIFKINKILVFNNIFIGLLLMIYIKRE